VHHIVQIPIPIFELALTGCDAFFAFDNSSNRYFFGTDALETDQVGAGGTEMAGA
jgi:hypothetical protein